MSLLAPNLAVLAEDALERLGERNALWFQGDMVKNTTIYERSRRLQRAFAELDLGRGDNVCLCMINNPMVYSVFGAGFRSGATVVPVISQLTPTELRYIFDHTECKCIVTDSGLIEKVRESIEGLDHVKCLAVLGGENRPGASPREYRLEDLLEYDEETTIADIKPDDIALMLYTSGTTGRPKGVMLAHENLMACAEAARTASELNHREPPLISINSLPMAHIFGVGVMNSGYIMPKEFAGGYAVQEIWFDPERFMQLIQEHKCTDISAVPAMLALILSHPNVDQYDLTSIQVVGVGAAPVPLEVAKGFSELCGCRIRQLYGMTENGGLGSSHPISMPYHPGSAGRPYANMTLRIFDDNDNELPPGEKGEIVTQGPSTMKGYFKQPEETAVALRGGWMHTGDIGYLDEEGWLYVVDRKKDMIIKGGENIFPADVENGLYSHPKVGEAAVVGVPHKIYGEDVVAFVVLHAGADLDEEELIAHVKTEVAKFKAPSKIHFVGELPKNGVGKILRRELRDQAAGLAKEQPAKES